MSLCTAQCQILLLCAKTVVRDLHNFEVANLKKKKTDFSYLVTFWFSTLVMHFAPLGVLSHYKFTIFDCIDIYLVSVQSLDSYMSSLPTKILSRNTHGAK